MRYLAYDVELNVLGPASALAFSPRQRAAQLVDAAEARVLESCRSARSLSEHADEILARFPGSPASPAHGPDGSQRDVVLQCLDGLIAKGLIVSESQALDSLSIATPDRSSDVTGTIASLCIPTRNRPEHLRRALASYLDNDRRYARTTEVVVVDDSEEQTMAARTLAVVQEVGRDAGRQVRYVSRQARERYAADLARVTGLPVDLTHFALVGEWGGTRNTILLETVGSMFLQVDDDTVCTVFRPPVSTDALQFSSRWDVNDYWFYPSLEHAIAGGERVSADLLSLHEAVLGRSLGALVSSMPHQPAIGEYVRPTLLGNAGHPEARIAVSYGGMIGHWGGLALPQYRLGVSGASFDRLVASQEAFEASYRSMQAIRCVSRPTVVDVDYCITAHMAVVNRGLLPPFMPLGAGEDTLFGVMRGALCAPACAAFIPFGILHDRGAEGPPREMPVPTVRMNDLLIHLTNQFLQLWPARGHAGLLGQLGEYLSQVARLDPEEFRSYVRRLLHVHLVSRRQSFDGLLRARSTAPEFWRVEVRAYQAQFEALMRDPHPASPSDLAGDAPERQRRFQKVLERFGTLLGAWPEMLRGAAELRARGQRPSAG